MSSDETPQCQQIKTTGARCGSPAQRDLKYCYFHQRSFPTQFKVEPHRRQRGPYDILLPAFEDASSIQVALHQLTELILRNRIEHKVAGLALYALQIASSNLKRMSQETPKPADVVVDPPPHHEADIAAAFAKALAETDSRDEEDDDEARPDNVPPTDDVPPDDVPPGTIQACQARNTKVSKPENNRNRNADRGSLQKLKPEIPNHEIPRHEIPRHEIPRHEIPRQRPNPESPKRQRQYVN